jgi:hypothetical protein
LLVNLDLLSFFLRNTTKGTAIDVQQGHQAIVADVDKYIFMLAAFGVQFVPFWLMIFWQVSRFVLFNQFIIQERDADSCYFGLWFTSWLNFVLEDIIGGFSLGQSGDDCFEVAEGAGYVCFFHISYDLLFLPFAYFACFVVHEGSSQFIGASLAYFRAEGNLMCLLIIVQALDDYIRKLGMVVLAQLAIFYVLL